MEFRRIKHLLESAQIDYASQYLKVYIAYNIWYREVTGAQGDREAIQLLKKRFIIWKEYVEGRVMKRLRVHLEHIAELTQRESLRTPSSARWCGEVKGVDDWQSLIEYWYRVRCMVVHGEGVGEQHIQLAYQSLSIFLNEIIGRVERRLHDLNNDEVQELADLQRKGLVRSSRFIQLQQKLYFKYSTSPNMWAVDMQHR